MIETIKRLIAEKKWWLAVIAIAIFAASMFLPQLMP